MRSRKAGPPREELFISKPEYNGDRYSWYGKKSQRRITVFQKFCAEFLSPFYKGFPVMTVFSRHAFQRQGMTSSEEYLPAFQIFGLYESARQRDILCIDQIPEAGMYKKITVSPDDNLSFGGGASDGAFSGMNVNVHAERPQHVTALVFIKQDRRIFAYDRMIERCHHLPCLFFSGGCHNKNDNTTTNTGSPL